MEANLLVYSLSDLKQLNNKVYGVIGCPIRHSMSPEIHNRLFELNGIKAEYIMAKISGSELKAAVDIFRKCFSGFNVTIPHKETIIPYLDKIDEKAKWYGAVNTVKNENGILTGYNTDGDGFKYSLEKTNINPRGKKVLILGAGGVSRVIAYEIALMGGKINIYSLEKTESLVNRLKEDLPDAEINGLESLKSTDIFDIIINGTPVGMWPLINHLPVREEIISSAEAVFDAVYNPVRTKLLLKACEKGAAVQGGLLMLVSQAAASQTIWTGKSFEESGIDNICKKIKKELNDKFPVNIVLSGFMGSGKTTVGRCLAKYLKREFYDLDRAIVKDNKMQIPEIFEKYGEDTFREMESKALSGIAGKKGIVLALGGGTLTKAENINILKQNANIIIFLYTSPFKVLERVGNGESRPMLKGDIEEKINTLYKERRPLYIKASDITVNSDNDIETVVNEILNALDLKEDML